MLRTSVFARRYIQGAGALDQLAPELDRLGKKYFCLVDRVVLERLRPAFARLPAGSVTLHPFEGHCTEPMLAAVKIAVVASGADVIVGCGGGSAIDVGRASAAGLDVAFVSVPTVAATDAPCSGISILYDEHGVMKSRITVRNPDLVLVDSAVIAEAPVRFFVSGLGDGLATWYEAESCRRSGASTISGGAGTALAHAAAKLCRDIILEKGVQAVADCKAHLATPDLEDVLEATVLLSGLGFESGGLAAAHAINNGLTLLPDAGATMHGEKVAFGLLASLFLSSWPTAERELLFRFCADVGLPVRLHQVGASARNEAALRMVADKACQRGANIHNEPFPVTADMVVTALKSADAFGVAFEAAAA